MFVNNMKHVELKIDQILITVSWIYFKTRLTGY